MTQPAVKMNNMRKSFGSQVAVDGASLQALPGRAVALVGANGAGKSTMMNILGGVVGADAGEVRIDGEVVTIDTPAAARQHGIQFVHQELSVFQTMTVAENIFIDEMPTRMGIRDDRLMEKRSSELLSQLGSNLQPNRVLEGLSTGDCQIIEIARAMRANPRVLILDEPTSSLSEREKQKLNDVVLLLKSQGVAIIYITHFISEIFEICDQVMVMRNGQTIADRPIDEIDTQGVIELMLGEVGKVARDTATELTDKKPFLTVENLNLPNKVNDASFKVGAGEIVGIWGLLGSGRTELMRSLLALDGSPTGRISLANGDSVMPTTTEALTQITAFVSEDRRNEGLLQSMSIERNTALPNPDKTVSQIGLILAEKVRALAVRVIERLGVKAQNPAQPVSSLSGGNQQKLVFGKWLETNPQLILLDEPTRGIDIAAKADLLNIAVDLARDGVAILFVSSELQELMTISHRYLVMSERRIVAELPGSATEEELIVALAESDAVQNRETIS